MTQRTALFYAAEPGDPARLVGRQVANHGFLEAYLRHGKPGAVPVLASAGDFERFKAEFPGDRELLHVPSTRMSSLAEQHGLFMPGPALAKRAWHRQTVGRGRYSLTGVTHTMSSERAQDAIREMVAAPMASWDALICTSKAIRTLVENIASDYCAALRGLHGGRPQFQPQLPIIPLGVDTVTLGAIGEAPGRTFRSANGIADDAFTVLYLGRLSYHTKAHPVPMYRALNLLAERIGRPVALIEAGWYYNAETEAAFAAAARDFAPKVQLVKVDARDAATKAAVLSAADVFLSMTDNAQESFGLTPVEAMAAGLPAIVSDWDGYRDTVTDGETGFLIPTLLPPAASGWEYAWRQASGQDDYDTHVGLIAQHVAVDIPKTVEALTALAGDADKTAAMGAAAARRARAIYDWKVIVAAYDALWQELLERRAFYSNEEAKVVPQIMDPFAVYACFASGTIEPPFSVKPVTEAEALLEKLAASPISAMDRRSLEDGRGLVAAMRQQGAMVLHEELTPDQASQAARTFRSLVWLLKMGVIEKS